MATKWKVVIMDDETTGRSMFVEDSFELTYKVGEVTIPQENSLIFAFGSYREAVRYAHMKKYYTQRTRFHRLGIAELETSTKAVKTLRAPTNFHDSRIMRFWKDVKDRSLLKVLGNCSPCDYVVHLLKSAKVVAITPVT